MCYQAPCPTRNTLVACKIIYQQEYHSNVINKRSYTFFFFGEGWQERATLSMYICMCVCELCVLIWYYRNVVSNFWEF